MSLHPLIEAARSGLPEDIARLESYCDHEGLVIGKKEAPDLQGCKVSLPSKRSHIKQGPEDSGILKAIDQILPVDPSENLVFAIRRTVGRHVAVYLILTALSKSFRHKFDTNGEGNLVIGWEKPSLGQKIRGLLVSSPKPLHRKEIERRLFQKISKSKLHYAVMSDKTIIRLETETYGTRSHFGLSEAAKSVHRKAVREYLKEHPDVRIPQLTKTLNGGWFGKLEHRVFDYEVDEWVKTLRKSM